MSEKKDKAFQYDIENIDALKATLKSIDEGKIKLPAFLVTQLRERILKVEEYVKG